MYNPLVRSATDLLEKYGMEAASLIRQSYSESFGDAEAVYRLGSVVLRFRSDRCIDTVDIAMSSNPRRLYNFDHIAAWMTWRSFNEILKAYDTPTDFDGPPQGPIFGLEESVRLIGHDLEKLQEAFSFTRRRSTIAQIEDVERRFSALLRHRWS